ncbi:MAG: branched-chain amino acid ABC transporter permease [Natronospirillum sp.]
MDWFVAGFLIQDGLTAAAVYALIAFSLVLIFSVTRVIFIGIGEFLAFAALSLAAIQTGQMPFTAYILIGFGILTFITLLWRGVRQKNASLLHLLLMNGLKFLVGPLLIYLALLLYVDRFSNIYLDMLLTLILLVPMGSMLYRVFYQPLSEASVLILLIFSVAVHFALLGLGLLMFGPEGVRTLPVTRISFQVGGIPVAGQAIFIGTLTLLLIAALWFFFTRTLTGKALQATAINSRGAHLVGIGSHEAGRLAFTLGVALAVLCGIVMSPIATIAYDTGFLIALKGFVAAIIGGLFSFPVAALGALLVGLVEAFSSFWASAYKEIIVYTLIIPVLLWQSLNGKHH